MNGLVIKIASLVLGLGVSFLALSCAPGPQNANQNQSGTNASPANVNVALLPIERDPTCELTDLEDRRREVEKRINAKIEDDDDLKKMLKGHSGKPKRFEFVVTKVAGSYRPFLEARFKGVITQKTQLDDLVKRLDNFMFEGCVHRVVFGQPGTGLPLADRTIDGFEWHYCDYPTVACPNGECKENCNTITTNGNSNSNANANTNVNSNTSSNANRSNMNTRP